MAALPTLPSGEDRNDSRRYRLVVADDHQDVLEEIRALLIPDFELVGTVKDGEELVAAAAKLRPDAVVCDIWMPGPNGIECGAEILRNGYCHAVVVLTMCSDAPVVRHALRQGIQGYVLKEDAGNELIPAVRAVLAGGRYLSSGVLDKGQSDTRL